MQQQSPNISLSAIQIQGLELLDGYLYQKTRNNKLSALCILKFDSNPRKQLKQTRTITALAPTLINAYGEEGKQEQLNLNANKKTRKRYRIKMLMERMQGIIQEIKKQYHQNQQQQLQQSQQQLQNQFKSAVFQKILYLQQCLNNLQNKITNSIQKPTKIQQNNKNMNNYKNQLSAIINTNLDIPLQSNPVPVKPAPVPTSTSISSHCIRSALSHPNHKQISRNKKYEQQADTVKSTSPKNSYFSPLKNANTNGIDKIHPIFKPKYIPMREKFDNLEAIIPVRGMLGTNDNRNRKSHQDSNQNGKQEFQYASDGEFGYQNMTGSQGFRKGIMTQRIMKGTSNPEHQFNIDNYNAQKIRKQISPQKLPKSRKSETIQPQNDTTNNSNSNNPNLNGNVNKMITRTRPKFKASIQPEKKQAPSPLQHKISNNSLNGLENSIQFYASLDHFSQENKKFFVFDTPDSILPPVLPIGQPQPITPSASGQGQGDGWGSEEDQPQSPTIFHYRHKESVELSGFRLNGRPLGKSRSISKSKSNSRSKSKNKKAIPNGNNHINMNNNNINNVNAQWNFNPNLIFTEVKEFKLV